MAGEAGVFLGLWLQKPLHIGAVCPSSPHLAAATARLADFSRPGWILELGAGTGGLTAGLLAVGCPRERLVALEAEARLAEVLRRKFEGIRVIVGDAIELDRLLHDHGINQLSVVVSSLPVKWFSLEAQRSVAVPCFDRLGPGGHFLQITNAFSSPLSCDRLGIAGREASRVWRNVPPAQIWVYRKASDVWDWRVS